MQIDETTLESLHIALNRLKNFDNTNLGLISENRIKNRNYSHFRRLNERTAVVDWKKKTIMAPMALYFNATMKSPYNF